MDNDKMSSKFLGNLGFWRKKHGPLFGIVSRLESCIWHMSLTLISYIFTLWLLTITHVLPFGCSMMHPSIITSVLLHVRFVFGSDGALLKSLLQAATLLLFFGNATDLETSGNICQLRPVRPCCGWSGSHSMHPHPLKGFGPIRQSPHYGLVQK